MGSWRELTQYKMEGTQYKAKELFTHSVTSLVLLGDQFIYPPIECIWTERKPEELERNHADTGRTFKGHTEKPLDSWVLES